MGYEATPATLAKVRFAVEFVVHTFTEKYGQPSFIIETKFVEDEIIFRVVKKESN